MSWRCAEPDCPTAGSPQLPGRSATADQAFYAHWLTTHYKPQALHRPGQGNHVDRKRTR